jgi:hypothetical protein
MCRICLNTQQCNSRPSLEFLCALYHISFFHELPFFPIFLSPLNFPFIAACHLYVTLMPKLLLSLYTHFCYHCLCKSSMFLFFLFFLFHSISFPILDRPFSLSFLFSFAFLSYSHIFLSSNNLVTTIVYILLDK